MCAQKKKSRATTGGLTAGFAFVLKGNPRFAPHLGRLRRCTIAAEAHLPSHFVLCGCSRSTRFHTIFQSTLKKKIRLHFCESLFKLRTEGLASSLASLSPSSSFFLFLFLLHWSCEQLSVATARGYFWMAIITRRDRLCLSTASPAANALTARHHRCQQGRPSSSLEVPLGTRTEWRFGTDADFTQLVQKSSRTHRRAPIIACDAILPIRWPRGRSRGNRLSEVEPFIKQGATAHARM